LIKETISYIIIGRKDNLIEPDGNAGAFPEGCTDDSAKKGTPDLKEGGMV